MGWISFLSPHHLLIIFVFFLLFFLVTSKNFDLILAYTYIRSNSIHIKLTIPHQHIEIGVDGVKAEVGHDVEGGAWIALNVRLVGTEDPVVLQEHSGDRSEAVEIRVDVEQPTIPTRWHKCMHMCSE